MSAENASDWSSARRAREISDWKTSAIQLHCTVRLTAVIFHQVILITCDLIGYTTSWTFLSCNWGPQLSTYGGTGLCKGTLLGGGYITVAVSLCSSLWPGADKRHLQATRRNTQRRGRAFWWHICVPRGRAFRPTSPSIKSSRIKCVFRCAAFTGANCRWWLSGRAVKKKWM